MPTPPARPRAKWKRWSLRAAIAFGVAAALSGAAFWVALCWPMNAALYRDERYSHTMLDRNGAPLHAFLDAQEQWRFPFNAGSSPAALNARLIEATLAAEDQRFYVHHGVDPIAVARAAWSNLTSARIVSGASTITMQTIKFADGPAQGFAGKARQAMQAMRLERQWSKREILAAYLDRAPYGGNLLGCEAASRRYFGKPAAELSLAEAALLAGLPQSPTAYDPIRRPERARARRDFVLSRMREEGYIDEGEWQSARAEPLGAGWHEFPALAPHLADRFAPLFDQASAPRATIDAGIQGNAESLVAEWVEKEARRKGSNSSATQNAAGVTPEPAPAPNAALIVVDVASAQVLAYVGSADFFAEGYGQYDAVRATRSPGSTLKPLIYGLAMQEQRLYGDEVLLDASLEIGRLRALNFSGGYSGLVPASQALRRSLNIPAILALERAGVGNTLDFLHRAGFDDMEPDAENYGAGLALGAADASLEQLAAAYTAIANQGLWRSLKYSPPQIFPQEEAGSQREPGEVEVLGLEKSQPYRMLPSGICLKLFQMLRQPLPDEIDTAGMPVADAPTPVAWKTGTSNGRRDAWAMVFDTRYVVGIWRGNNDGSPSRSLVGAEAALPLAARVFRALPATGASAGERWPDLARGLRKAKVCAQTGLPASAFCPVQVDGTFPPEQFLNRVCDVHCPLPNDRIGERWPAAAMNWDLANVRAPLPVESVGAKVVSPPNPIAHNAVIPVAAVAISQPSANTRELRILEPANGAEILLSSEAASRQIRLRSTHDGGAPVHWYCDDRYLGAATRFEPLLLELTPGAHKLVCLLPDGKTDTVRFMVTDINPDQ